MSSRGDGNKNPQGAKVLKLGLNISVSGDPGTDFEIVLDENGQKPIEKTKSSDLLALENSESNVSSKEEDIQEVTYSTGAISKPKKSTQNMNLSDSPRESEEEKQESKDPSIIDKIKTTLEHFEKFSDHIKEIPRLRNHPIATSTPFTDKRSSKSESSLVPDYRPRKYGYLYDFQSRKDYYRSSVKPPDLFLKPLPGENFYKRGMYTRYFDVEPYRHYGSDNSLNKASENNIVCTKSKYDVDKYDGYNSPIDLPPGILKRSDSESGDKHSTSSADSIKDIKIYQSGGILIMQNFKDSLDANEKREMSDFSAKLIENCNKLKEEISNFQMEKPFIDNTSDDYKHSGKTVQFDLAGVDGQKSKSADSSATKDDSVSLMRMESSESTSDCLKTKDNSPQGTTQSQDFTSLSTQENDSILSNQPGTSPTFVSPKKLEWDSGADIGYMNLDLMKENLSTIERIVLKGLSSDGLSEKNVVYEKLPEKNQSSRSKFVLERVPSDLIIEEILDGKEKRDAGPSPESQKKETEKDKPLRRVSESKKSKKLSKDGIDGKRNGTSQEVPKGGSISNESAKGIPSSNTEKEPKEKHSYTTDKSINVNTLWEDYETPLNQSAETENLKQTESEVKTKNRRYSPKVKKLKKKKPQKPAPLKHNIETPPSSGFLTDMGLPKKNNKNIKAIPVLNDMELSKGVEEIVIDQRYKTKPSSNDGEKDSKEAAGCETPVGDNLESKPDGKVKSRPISASSGSNNTILPKTVDKSVNESNFTNQLIQTSELDCESVGIQAFASQVSSDCDFKTRERLNTSSKNIQAFGLNASLPKQLEHPKQSTESTNQNTKSTQFFGGAVNSLPNYHSNLVTKPGESCGRPKILKAKKNLEAEIIRLKEENEKNILANDAPEDVDSKTDSRKRNNNENKENLIKGKCTNSKKSQSDASRKTSKGNETDSEKKESEHLSSKAKKALSVEGSECPHTSDEVSSMVLTSEVLKVHGDSIDRNIIQEKYFQSQLVEFQKRKMVTRSTSMEKQTGEEENAKKYTSTACQYSPQSVEVTNEESKYQENDCSAQPKNQEKGTSEQYDSSQNIGEDCFETLKSTNQEQGLGGGDSLPSSTQTAHSWIPGMQNPGDNVSGVGRARSFEYLPGHIYESSGNLREELPSETEQNIITSSSSDSDTAKHSLSDRARESEGRRTLVLENSTESSQDSDRLMTLDGNLTRLDFAVLKLREKDAQMQNVIRSLLASFWKRKGSGDFSALDGADASKSEIINNREVSNVGKERGDTPSYVSDEQSKKVNRETEMSIGCQTEDKSSSSDPEKFYEKKKALEKRISEEKKCQIKWIENEIYHLNILRELLEKQNSAKKKPKHSPVTSNEVSKSDETYVENIPTDVRPPPVTPAYGCTISVTENAIFEEQPHSIEREKSPSQWCQDAQEEPVQYGMAVSLSGKNNSKSWRRVVMFPVGVQVSLKDSNMEECYYKGAGNEGEFYHRHSPKCSMPDEPEMQYNPYNRNGVSQYDVNTQYPSGRRNSGNCPSASRQTSFTPTERCGRCREENCVCLNLEKSYSSPSRSSRSRTSERRGSSKLTSLSEEPELRNENENKISCSTENYKKSNSPANYSKRKSAHGSNCKCQNEKQAKQKAIQNPDCRCENCFVQVSSTSKPNFSYLCPCQSNIYLNIEKPSSNVGSCCSKNQKSSNSPCHIIKIHGAKCCSPGKGFCCCKGRSKRVENQSCQTDLADVVRDDSDGRLRTEGVESVSLDCPESYNQRSEQSGATSKQQTPESNVPQQIQRSNCVCNRKSEKEKTADDDHPRHYFLRIEETEVDEDSNELTEPQKSLEVITVKVPVKKAGKGKIYGKKIQETRESYQNSVKNVDYSPSGCNCCSDCIMQRSKSVQKYEPRFEGGYRRRSVAEKPESPRRDYEPCARQTNSDEMSNPFGAVGYRSRESNQEYSPQDYDQNLDQSECYYPERRENGSNPPHSCDRCRGNNFPGNVQQIQNEYDSHKKSRTCGNKDRNSIFQEKRNNSRDANGEKSWSSESRSSRQQEFQQNHDFYNYNKREFMTKSELLKEEKQKERMHNPTLREYLSSNRPDFYNSAERRRQIISERAKERVRRHNNRMDCLINLIHRCNEQEQTSNGEPKRIFTTLQMREQTLKKYKKLPEVTGKLADRKKKEEYKTNKLMADIFAKKLQCEALKGHLNLSNSVALLNTI